MALARTVVLLLLLTVIVLFVFYAVTGQDRFKRRGLSILKWTLIAAFGFFAVLIAQRIA